MKFTRGYYDVLVHTCAKYHSEVAVIYYEDGLYKNFTYSELYGVCEYISQNLQQLKCFKGVIGLVTERNIIIPSIIAAAHKCGTTFMFLDPNHDIESVITDIKFTVIITIKKNDGSDNSELFGKKPEKSITVFNYIINFYNQALEPSSHMSYMLQHSFIAMTSGSTGKPKHIQVPIYCIQPNINDLTKLFNITHKDIIYFSTPLTFDPSMVEILLACLNGASLLIAPENSDILFPDNKKNCITFWQTTPSKFFQHSNADIRNKILSSHSTLRILAFGGEPLSGVNRLKELKDQYNKTKFFTLYGVTEMSCWACATEIDLNKILNEREIPLGKCLSETQLVVEPIKGIGDVGKIVLKSKTRKCFVLNKSRGDEVLNSLKFVDTGDLGEIRGGTVYYRGRIDDIIKRFGLKVNLQLIESTIMQCPNVMSCSCIWLPTPLLLVVYYSSENLKSQNLMDFIKCKLDDKHWPDKIIRVESLPINAHGKVSKQILCKMHEETSMKTQSLDSLKAQFINELRILLGKSLTYDQIRNKDFFTIGGSSFLAVTICNKLSLMYPEFSILILPHLVNHKTTFDEIMEIIQKEMCKEKTTKPKRCMKRTSSAIDNTVCKKSNIGVSMPFEVLWTYDTGKCVDGSPTLFKAIHNLYVTVGSHSGKIIVVDGVSGVLQGCITLQSRVEASPLCCSEHPVTTPCAVVGSYDGTVVCYTIDNCTELWRTGLNSMVKSKAVCLLGSLYVATYEGNIHCMNILTGDTIELIPISDQGISADLVIAKKKYLLIGTLAGECVCVLIETNSVVWRSTLGSPIFAKPVLYDDDKYVVFVEVQGVLHCRTVEKGIKIWKYCGATGNIFSSIYVKEIDKLKWQMVFGCHNNKVYSINIKNFQPSLHWKTQLTSPIYSTPCGFNDEMILAASNNGKLCVIDSENGALQAEHEFPGETFSSPAVYGDYVYIGCRNDLLYCLRNID